MWVGQGTAEGRFAWDRLPIRASAEVVSAVATIITTAHQFVQNNEGLKVAEPSTVINVDTEPPPHGYTSARGVVLCLVVDSGIVCIPSLVASSLWHVCVHVCVCRDTYKSAVSQRDLQRVFTALRFFWNHLVFRDALPVDDDAPLRDATLIKCVGCSFRAFDVVTLGVISDFAPLVCVCVHLFVGYRDFTAGPRFWRLVWCTTSACPHHCDTGCPTCYPGRQRVTPAALVPSHTWWRRRRTNTCETLCWTRASRTTTPSRLVPL